MAQLKKHLSAAEFVKIRRPVRILGSASVSTAIEFELNDGRRVVILTQRPNAREQVKGNADGMRLFVEKMSKADPSFPRTAALMFIQVAESQILEELNYLNTVKKIAAAREFYGRMNRTMRKTLGDFRFYVPDIVAGFEPHPEVLVIEKIEGETFDKLPVGSAREQVGRSIVVSGLESFFLENWFNEDQHERQFKIDLNHRVPIDGGAFYPINVFDFGKSSFAVRLSPWKSDTQYRFAQLFRALEAGNLNASIDEAFKMSMTEDARVHPDMKLIKSNVMKLAAPAFTSDKSVMDRILALREAFETEQLIFPDSFYLGRLKGMMMLSREEFVPEKEFDKLIHGYVVRALVNKSPLLVGEMAKNMVNGTCDYMLQKIPGS